MEKTVGKAILRGVIGGLIVGLSLGVFELKDQLAAETAQVTQLQEVVVGLETEVDSLQEDKGAADKLAALRIENNALRFEKDAAAQHIEKLNKEVEELQNNAR